MLCRNFKTQMANGKWQKSWVFALSPGRGWPASGVFTRRRGPGEGVAQTSCFSKSADVPAMNL